MTDLAGPGRRVLISVAVVLAMIVALVPLALAASACQGIPVDSGKGGTSGSDHYVGDSSSNSMAGEGADDHLEGLGSVDYLCGNEDNDHLEGGSGYDFLNGGDNRDITNLGLEGGPDDDELRGGAYGDEAHGDGGDDIVAGDDGPDDLYGALGFDELLDGGSADNDTMTGNGSYDIFWMCPDGTADTRPDYSEAEDDTVFLTSDPNDPYHSYYVVYC